MLHLSEQSGLLTDSSENETTNGETRHFTELNDIHNRHMDLFSDLVMALSIQILAHEVVENQFTDAKLWLTFWLRIFLLHSIWASGILITNISNIHLGYAFQVTRHIGSFAILTLVAAFIKACERDDTHTGVFVYLVARGLAAGAVLLHAFFWMDPGQQGRINTSFCCVPVLLILDCGPLLWVVIHLKEEQEMVLWAGFTTVILGIVTRIALANNLNIFIHLVDDNHSSHQLSHMKERHQFIIIVLLAGVFLAATTSAQDYLGTISSVAAIFTSIGGFVLYVTAHAKGSVDAWSLTPRTLCLSQQLHLVLFGTISSMAIAFSQIIRVDEDVLYYRETNAFAYRHPQTLLSMAVAVFLVTIAELMDLSADPIAMTTRFSKQWRVKFIMLMGVIVAVLLHYCDNAMLIAAVSITISALVELFSVQIV